ncbi:MAG: hypothetical protein K5695_12565 [Oscillospiraceae bacterium]|nr:hypothetical protein [Oscillospiraceae bacterium]
MKNIVIYGSKEDWSIPLVKAAGEFSVQVIDRQDFTGTADCILISQEFAGNRLSDVIGRFKQYGLPCAVLTAEQGAENQKYLLNCGADDVIAAPICAALMQRRIRALTEIPVSSDFEMNFAAFDRVMEANQGTGAFLVSEHDFMNIYRFVVRLLERLEKKAMLLLFSFESEDGEMGAANSALHFLKIMQMSLRKGDITCNYGSQVLAILMGADAEGGRLVAERVIRAFDAHYNMDESCTVTYEVREISNASKS